MLGNIQDMRLTSQPAVNLLLYIVCIALGAGLMWLARHFSMADTNTLCGFLLGVMLFVLGAWALLIDESRTVEWNEQNRTIVLDIRRRFGGNRVLEIPFGEIASVGLDCQGEASAGSRYYDLVVKLKTGKEIYLFGGCAFEGRMNRAQVEQWKQRLERAVNQG